MKDQVRFDEVEVPEKSFFEEAMERQGETEAMPAEVWADISTEEFRTYIFPGEVQAVVRDPVALAVNQQGSHRIIDRAGMSHFIPAGWHHLVWKSDDAHPYFAS